MVLPQIQTSLASFLTRTLPAIVLRAQPGPPSASEPPVATTWRPILLPQTAQQKPQQGKVIAAGNGKIKDDGQRIALDVVAGDLILFGKYSGQEIKLEGEEYLIMREDEVLAVIDDGAKKDTKKK